MYMRYTYFLTKTKQMEYADIQIDDIILRLFNGTASPDDIATLSRWMEKDAANRQYFEQQQREWNADGGGDIASHIRLRSCFRMFRTPHCTRQRRTYSRRIRCRRNYSAPLMEHQPPVVALATTRSSKRGSRCAHRDWHLAELQPLHQAIRRPLRQHGQRRGSGRLASQGDAARRHCRMAQRRFAAELFARFRHNQPQRTHQRRGIFRGRQGFGHAHVSMQQQHVRA